MTKLNEKAETQLKILGFHKTQFNPTMSELDRIKANYELVRQINQFSSKGQVFSKLQIVRVMRIMSLTIETSISDQEQSILLPQH